ncbi:GTP cyclohydrolase [Flaviaesturariibacter flavus]|uniref:GTP cyclohydrolase n=1 Tax=Flaviaesturariibacter flavus TaxID=2502780 RepID=A0A4R1B942_9BACT|nr:YciI family protein [Flaviaesturariibacter flavus]TCJ13099.1 GTP cyclohydrolase [Flaviaesturariibacter flavus]
MFLISLTYRVAPEEVDRHLEAHAAFLDRHYAAGHFVFSGPKVPRTGGVILAHGLSHEAVMQLISEDPFYLNSIANYHVQELQPTKWDPRFAPFAGG